MSAQKPNPADLYTISENLKAEGQTSRAEVIENAAREYNHAIELLRKVNKMGGVVVEYFQKRTLREWITEFLDEVDGKAVVK